MTNEERIQTIADDFIDNHPILTAFIRFAFMLLFVIILSGWLCLGVTLASINKPVLNVLGAIILLSIPAAYATKLFYY